MLHFIFSLLSFTDVFCNISVLNMFSVGDQYCNVNLLDKVLNFQLNTAKRQTNGTFLKVWTVYIISNCNTLICK